jgi:hypothetical protein
MKEYIGCCVDNPFNSLEELSNIIDNWEEITIKEFLLKTNIENIELLRDFILYPNSFVFYKYNNIYFYENSCIEYFYE